MTIREELYHLIDQLPEGELLTARRFLRYLNDMSTDPVLRAMAEAPVDDEAETEEERAAIQEAREALARGEVIPLAELPREQDA